MNISRNSLCPCGSGKRFKHCCGASQYFGFDASSQALIRTRTNLAKALELQRGGQDEAAATIFEAIFESEPDNLDAHNMLVIIRAKQWRMAEAMRHARRTNELTNWDVPFFHQNYIALILKALGNVEETRFKQNRSRYLEVLSVPSTPIISSPSISILLFEQSSPAELKQCLTNLAEQVLKPYEVLIPAELAELVVATTWPFPVRWLNTPVCSAPEIINFLADAARGDYLLALRKSDVLLPEHLSNLSNAIGSSGRWSFANYTLPLSEAADPTENLPTTGFSLLSQIDRIVTESNLLVPRGLHQRIGGYDPRSSAPLLDYCLRLLWEMEPLAALDETCMPDTQVRENTAHRLSAIGNYLDKAFSDVPSLNPFAPSRQNWGLRLHLHIARQKLFASPRLMAVVNTEIETYLRHKERRRLEPTLGINLIGPARGEFGLAENMRAFARASLEGHIPCAVRDLNLALPTRQSDNSLDAHFVEEARHNCSIFFLNPDARQLYTQSLDGVAFERPSVDFRHIKIGYWFWELEKIPAQWDYAFDKVDEIWVATEFIAAAMRRATNKPVIKIPTPIVFDVKGEYGRNYFGLPPDTFIFLFSFDFNSFPERKNPYALISAFQRAFQHRQDVTLLIKSINGANRPDAMRALLDEAGNDPRILLRDGFMSRDEIFGLQSVIDAYASLHRAEGLGLGLAECMYQGKPVIGTAYSGNLEFMNEANSGLVNYTLVPINKGEYLYDDPGFFWAEPDEEHATYLMAKLVDDAAYRNRIAAQGREDIRRGFNYAVTAERMKIRLREIGAI